MQIRCADEFQRCIAKIKNVPVFHYPMRKIAVHQIFHVTDRVTGPYYGGIGSFVQQQFNRSAVIRLRMVENDVFNFAEWCQCA
ncbi:hypothetical protein SDC9_73225 [bioreactor metagenome]|uniref:Uncharacterized protein n=1 Tax=bioreactor metagenome TaxID=1076179 RepID=A0A644YE53_9ZZZZ